MFVYSGHAFSYTNFGSNCQHTTGSAWMLNFYMAMAPMWNLSSPVNLSWVGARALE